jgi:hypothetical protein
LSIEDRDKLIARQPALGTEVYGAVAEMGLEK